MNNKIQTYSNDFYYLFKNSTILITGASGFVGRNLIHYIKENVPHKFLLHPSSKTLDLTNQERVEQYFQFNNVDYVIHLAGRVGGILLNKQSQGQQFYENSLMGIFLYEACRKNKVKKMVSLGAGCGYPNSLIPPYKESNFFSGMPEINSFGYSMAKKNLIIQGWSYKEQYNFDSTVLLPANLYGPYDNFHIHDSHVVPALVRKFIEAKQENKKEVVVWGSGKATREFLYVEDMVKVILESFSVNQLGPYNVGTGVETSIVDLINEIKKQVGYEGEILWKYPKLDGQQRRVYDLTKLKKDFSNIPSTTLSDGLKETIEWYKQNQDRARK